MSDILITKIRTGGNRMVRADTKGSQGSGTWFNVNELNADTVRRIREVADEHNAIADDLEQSIAEGVDW